MRITYITHTVDDLLWGIRFWWPHRHGINAGEIRIFIRRRIIALRCKYQAKRA